MSTEIDAPMQSRVREQLQVSVLVLGELASHTKQPSLDEQLRGKVELRLHMLPYGRTIHGGSFVELIGLPDPALTQFHRLATHRVTELSSDSQESVVRAVADADLVFIVTGDADIDKRALLAVSKIAKLMGALVVGFVVGRVAPDDSQLHVIADFGVFVARIASAKACGTIIHHMLSGVLGQGLICTDFADMCSVLDNGGQGCVVLTQGNDLAEATLLAAEEIRLAGATNKCASLYAILAGDQRARMAEIHAAINVLLNGMKNDGTAIFSAPLHTTPRNPMWKVCLVVSGIDFQ